MQSFFIWIFEQLFPQRCCVCKALDKQEFCFSCKSTIILNPMCVNRDSLSIYTLYDYNQLIIQIALKQWKYARRKSISETLLEGANLKELREYDEIIPVPMHRRREVERGTNHAELLAFQVSKVIKKPCSKKLKRTRSTTQQAKLNKQERRKNLENAFKVVGDVSEKKILLVDDIVSTGETLQACKKSLEQAGAKQIGAFCLARNQKNSL